MIENLIPQKVKDLEEYRPNMTPCSVRLDANESPFLPSKAVLDELAKAVYTLDFNRYPDPYATKLVDAFSKIYGVCPDNVVAGNGSDELISLICSGLTEPSDTVAVALPDFSMYEFYSTLSGATAMHFIKSENFEIDFNELFTKTSEVNAKIVIFSNPCNPTGGISPRNELEAFIKKSGSIVVVDEAYMEFASTDESVIDLIEKYDNLIVLKTMSKAYGAAALRLGFAITNPILASAIRKIKSPYNVNSVSQVFGEIILSHYDEIKKKIEELKDNLAYLREQLEAIKSDKIVKICPSAANFVYMQMCCPDAARAIYHKLLSEGVAIRCMSNGYLRICGGTREEINIFIKKFKEAIS